VLDGYRGAPAWDRDRLTDLLVRAGELVAGGRDWIRSMDVNPILVTADGLVAVDAVCFLETNDPGGDDPSGTDTHDRRNHAHT
jgi:hypothetical protein